MKRLLALALVIVALGVVVGVAEDIDDTVIVVSPNVLNIQSDAVWVTVHAEIPYSIVQGVSVELNGIPVEVTKADNRGELVAKFISGDVKDIAECGVMNVLTLTGVTDTGEAFSGTDEILVIDQAGKP